MSYNAFHESLARALRLAKEEEERKRREQQLKMAALFGFALLGGAAVANSKPTLLGGLFDTKRVFVSFDYDNDKRYKYLLEAWHSNPKFKFTFEDTTSGEINSRSVEVVKNALATKISQATHTLVIVGRYANALHKDSKQIGSRNWINYEVMCSKFYKKKIVAVKLNRNFVSPDELLNSGASWAMSFNEDAILKALEQA